MRHLGSVPSVFTHLYISSSDLFTVRQCAKEERVSVRKWKGNMHNWLDIPGDPFISRVLSCILIIGLQSGIFILALLVVRHYVKPISTGNRALGIIVGAILGIIAASGYASTYTKMFYSEPEKVSIFLILGCIGNVALSDFIFSRPKE